MNLPENLQRELRLLLEDLYPFVGKEPPKPLILQLARMGTTVEPYDKKLSDRLLVLFMAILPRQEGEPSIPEGMDLFIDFTLQDILHKLGGPCPVPPSPSSPLRTTST